MKMLNRLWRSGLALAIICLAIYSCGKPVPTIDVAELKRIKKSEGAQRVLISNDVRCISADETNVWIATDKGVSRFERSSGAWRHYTKEDGLNSDNINAIATDGNLVWFGTDDGVNRYNIETGVWQSFKEKDGLKGRMVLKIAVDRDYVWFGTDSAINRYDRSIDSWSARTQSDGLSYDVVSAIAVEDEYIWIGTHSRVNRYSKTTDSWNIYSTREGLVDDFVSTIAVSDNHVWFGTYHSGISVYNKTNQTFRKPYTKSDILSSDDIRSIAIDGNNIWVGTANGGVHRHIETVDVWVQYTKDDGLASNNISWITAFKNEIWLGTYDSGVSMYDKVKNTWITFAEAESPPEDQVNSIVSGDSGKAWIATSGGLLEHDPGVNEWTRYGKKDGLPTEYISDLRMDGDVLWIGTARGLASYDEKSENWKFYDKTDGLSESFITALAIADKAIWVGTNRGLFSASVNGQSLARTFEPMMELADYRITSIVPGDEVIWVGTDDGLQGYDIAAGELAKYTTEHGFPHNFINSVLVQEDQMWLGTRGGMVAHQRGGEPHIIAEGQNVRAIMNDPEWHSVWLGTTGGLVKYDTETGELKSMIEDSKYSITSITRRTDDVLWLGTTSGVVEYQVSSGDYREHRAFVTREPLREASVAHIEFDGDSIWFSNWSASHNGAIIRYDRQSDTWRRFTRETILGDTKVKSPTIVKWICADDRWVWFATDYGALQYDKSTDTWRHFTTADGLISNNIRRVESTNNAVWICPELRTRLSKYDKASGAWSEIKLSNLIHPRNYIYDMEPDGDALWLTLSSSGVRRVSEDGQQQVYMRDDGLAQMGARSIEVDEDYVWVAHWKDRGSGTLSRYDKRTGEWTAYSNSDVLEADMIADIVEGEEYTWFIYESWRKGSVTGYNRKTGEWTTIEPGAGWGSQIREVCEDGGYLWLAPEGGGIKRYHKASGTWTTFRSGSGPLMDFANERAFRADDKYVWLGTPGGISRYDKEKESWTDYTRQKMLSGESIRAVVSDDRYVWCGAPQGISRYDKVYGTWENLSKSSIPYTGGGTVLSWPEWQIRGNMVDDNVTALAVDDRYLWVATPSGAGRYDWVTDRWDGYGSRNGLPGTDVSSVVVDRHDVWMGTGGGIGKFPRVSDDPNAWISYTSGLEIKAGAMTREYANTLVSNEVWASAADNEYIWVGTMRGVSKYNKETDTWTTYTTKDGLSSDEISCVCVDGGAVWFGSDSGVTMYDIATEKWVTYTTGDGLASNRVTCIARSADTVWFGTFDAGITRYNKKDGTWRTYDRGDGLAHGCVLSVSVDENSIWIGTRLGLSRYDVDADSWTTYTQYVDSKAELEMVASQPKKGAERGETTPEAPQPVRGNLEMVEINANPPGRDEEKLNGEWVKILNVSGAPIDMTGFTLSDSAGHTYRFGELILTNGATVTIFTGFGTDSLESLYWMAKTPIWNNRGDTAYLKDADGKLIHMYSYPASGR
ncbi:lamin tail domain-containing protein [Candidatus Poribacteria bacterium]